MVLRRVVPLVDRRRVELVLERAEARPPLAPARRTVIRPVPDREPVEVLRRVPVERELVERARVPVLRRVPVVRRVPVERLLVERDRVVPVARRRAVVRPPFAAAARDGALRVVLRRVAVERARVPVLRRVPVVVRRVPVELELELLERRRVPPVEREREVVLRGLEAFAVPVERDRLVVVRLRPRLDAARTREMPSSCC